MNTYEKKRCLDLHVMSAPIGHVFSVGDIPDEAGGDALDAFVALGESFGDRVLLRPKDTRGDYVPGRYIVAKVAHARALR